MPRMLLFLVAAILTMPSLGVIESRPSVPALERWSDFDTWDGDPPSEGEVVTIPAGKRVLLDVSPPPLGGLTIDGTLVFDRQNLALATEWIMVRAGGALEIGTPEQPFRQRAVITLIDETRGEDLFGMGDRLIGQTGGRIDIHGRPATSWTRLAANAEPGDTVIELEEPPDWRRGDEIVIASTDFDAHQAEPARIVAIDGARIELDRPLEYLHWGTDQPYGDRVVSERAEAGLLSHNIVIGADESADERGFGGHIMTMAGQLRLSSVELTRMGQAGELARYPIHFHLKGDAPDDVIRGVSISRPYNRCVTIHGTNQVRLEGNVAYNAPGHCFFLEDGAETGNRLTGNLGILTRAPDERDELLPSDELPATFWITNPDNELIGNVAAGSEGIGFWYALPEHPTGFSRTEETEQTIWPRRTPLGAFRDNVAHSNGFRGLEVDSGPREDGTTEPFEYAAFSDPIPPDDGADDFSGAIAVTFEGFTAFKNRERGIWLRGINLSVRGATLADNGIGATLAAYDGYVEDALVVGETENIGSPSYEDEPMGEDGRSLPMPWDPTFRISGFEFYDGPIGVQDIAFAGFFPTETREASALSFLRFNAFELNPRSSIEGVTWLDDSKHVFYGPALQGYDGDKMRVFVDRDGSVTGIPGASVVANLPFLRASGCTQVPEWNGAVCSERFVTLTMEQDGIEPGPTGPIVITRDGAVSETLVGIGTPYEVYDPSYYATNLVPDATYRIAPKDLYRRLDLRLATARAGDTIIVEVAYGLNQRIAVVPVVFAPDDDGSDRRLRVVRTRFEVEVGDGREVYIDRERRIVVFKMRVPDGDIDTARYLCSPLDCDT